MGACNRDKDAGARNETTPPATTTPSDNTAMPPAPGPDTSMNNGSTTGDSQIQIAKAESDHTAAIQRCESLAADAQQACKDQADAALEAAKSQAETTPPAGQ